VGGLLGLAGGSRLGLSSLLLAHEVAMNVRNDTAAGDGGLDQRVQLLVSSNGQMQMARSDSLHLEILGGITSQLEHLGSQVLQNGGRVDSGGGSHAPMAGGALLQEAVDAAHWELEASPSTSGDHLGLGLAAVLAGFSLSASHFWFEVWSWG